MRIPNASLVAQAYLLSVSDGSYGISTTLPTLTVMDSKNLPKDNWGGKKAWVTPRSIGVSDFVPAPVRKSIITVTVWVKPYDKRRHWGDAESIAEELIALGTDWYSNLDLDMPYAGYRKVSLSSFSPVSGIRRIEADPQGLARTEFDAQLAYSL